MNRNPLLSICIPTRNRAFYLKHCLQTILVQDFTDYEIIVAENSDPAGREETRTALAGLDARRIVYFEQPEVVSMTANYESALAKTKGEYVLCLGDDDGMVAGSLRQVAELLRARQPAVLKSPTASYFWPDSRWHSQTAIYLAAAAPLTWVDSRSLLEKVAAFETPYYFLPMIYYAFVRRDLIDRIAADGQGFFADTTSIDIYAGMVIAANTETFLVGDRPFAIAGQSPKSNGAVFLGKQENVIADEYAKQHNLREQYANYKLPLNRSLEVLTLMELRRAMRRFPAATAGIQVDALECCRRCCGLAGAITCGASDPQKRAAVVREFEAADPDTPWHQVLEEAKPSANKPMLYPRGEVYSFMATKVLVHDLIRCDTVVEASNVIRAIYDGWPFVLEPPTGDTQPQPDPNKPGGFRAFMRQPGKALKRLFLGQSHGRPSP